MHIDIIQSSVTGQWNYCPTIAPESFKKCLAYEDKPSYLETADAAKDAALQNPTMPNGIEFTVIPNPNWVPPAPDSDRDDTFERFMGGA